MQKRPVIVGLILVVIFMIGTSFYANAQSSSIPNWIKNTAKWWSEGSVGDQDFINALQYLINNGIIKISKSKEQSSLDRQSSDVSSSLFDLLPSENDLKEFNNDVTLEKRISIQGSYFIETANPEVQIIKFESKKEASDYYSQIKSNMQMEKFSDICKGSSISGGGNNLKQIGCQKDNVVIYIYATNTNNELIYSIISNILKKI